MKLLLTLGLIALTFLISCEDDLKKSTDIPLTHDEIIHQQIIDTIASVDNLEVIGYFLYNYDGSISKGLRSLPDGTLEELPPEPWWNINSQIWLRETHSSESDNTFDVALEEDRLVINSERFAYWGDSLVKVTITVPYELIDSVDSQLLYYSDIPEYHRRFRQALGDDYIEGTDVQESLVLYMPVDLREVAVIEIEVIKPIP